MSQGAHKKDGFQKREPKEFDEEVIQIDRVTKVVKGGRRLRFRATVVIGNRKSKVGIGLGKSTEVTGAIQKAIAKAKKDLIEVVLDENTIPHDVQIKYKAAKILLMPATPGTGIIAGGTIRKVLELAGVKDILSKSFGTTNKVNTTRAAFEALKLLTNTPHMEARKAKKSAARQAAEATKAESKAVAKEANKEDVKAAPKKAVAKKPAAKKENTK